ncbi:hypothetical protein X727_08500 [Mesorhizobium sp. L103C119B0]|uniref:ORC-CDC6 family AAA ATPase n=1 Tax=Mesorhizobium sp. L103C119B0 TaxID=1287085 RepID=UPI0003D05862|nr:hypothetical protein [Mesorhizobium sp. L103C119B0]ESZ72465.1 hypothetical protein X727_08500 [Mesorhizobium sp. L103C119B0]
MRASQRSTSDDEFVRLFGVGALEVIKSFDDPWNGLVFLRSAPGGGKTTFLRILTPRPLKLTDNLADQHQQVKATRDALREVGAIGRDGPQLLGAMVVFTSEYKELSAFDRGNILFRELLNSRIVVATLRSVLERAERQFPDDLDQFSFEWEPESDATIPGRATGKELFTWASRIERDFYDRMDDLGSPASIKGGHARLDGLKWFAHVRISDAQGDMEVKRVLLMDELQTLASPQRASLIEFITNAREQCGVWIAERLEALTHKDLLSEGALRKRDYENVVQLEERWSGTRTKSYTKFVETIANLRAAKADGFEGRELFPLIGETDDIPSLETALTGRMAEIEAEVVKMAGVGPRYSNWLANARGLSGNLLERAFKWQLLKILVIRDTRRTQTSFDFDSLTLDEFGARSGSGTDRAAEHFLRSDVGAPIYFGRESLSAVSSSNVDQYLEVAGALFEEISAKIRFHRDQPVPLTAARQDALIRGVAKDRWDGLPRRLPRGVEARRLLEAIGEYCRQQTFRSSAPYAPGVTGIAITMDDRKLIIDSEDAEISHFIRLRDVMTSLVSHNLLMPRLDHRNNGREYVVFYLNRLLCVHFGLPLGYGGWRHQTLKSLLHWQEAGAKAIAVAEEATLV